MDNTDNKRESFVGRLRIRNMNYGFIAVLTVLAIVLFVITILLSGEYRKVAQMASNYRRVKHDATMVQNASDDLTRDVEFYVMTGERKYMDSYFTEADETKRRENAMDDLEKLHVTDALFKYLEDAVSESVNLMQLEYEAMRYAAEGFGSDISSLPDVVRQVGLPKEAESMTSEEKIDKAREIVFGETYLSYKNRITGYEDKFTDEALKMMEDKQAEGHRKIHFLLVIQWIVIILMVALGTILFIITSHFVANPLDQAVSSMIRGEKIYPIRGIYEVRYMASSYNGFHTHSTETQKRLKQDAELDDLTEVLNRRGYHTIVNKLASETDPLALLIFDVDHFKHINDNYGHEAGDQALKKLANVLKGTFREDDIIARIGGDEFIVIMMGADENEVDMISEKVRAVNESLTTVESGKLPGFTVSVGCAFSPAGYNSNTFSQADAKLFDVKKSGGNGIRFA